jgi:hypothetical protein
MTNSNDNFLKRQRYLVDLLLRVSTEDLRGAGWNFPNIKPGLALKIQAKGKQMFGDKFRYIAHDLEQFGKSNYLSRERAINGDIVYSTSAIDTPSDTIIFSATTHPEFAKYRLGVDLYSPFKGYVFRHQDSIWYNINNRIGMKDYFSHNAKQILDFYAGLVAKRFRPGESGAC